MNVIFRRGLQGTAQASRLREDTHAAIAFELARLRVWRGTLLLLPPARRTRLGIPTVDIRRPKILPGC